MNTEGCHFYILPVECINLDTTEKTSSIAKSRVTLKIYHKYKFDKQGFATKSEELSTKIGASCVERLEVDYPHNLIQKITAKVEIFDTAGEDELSLIDSFQENIPLGRINSNDIIVRFVQNKKAGESAKYSLLISPLRFKMEKAYTSISFIPFPKEISTVDGKSLEWIPKLSLHFPSREIAKSKANGSSEYATIKHAIGENFLRFSFAKLSFTIKDESGNFGPEPKYIFTKPITLDPRYHLDGNVFCTNCKISISDLKFMRNSTEFSVILTPVYLSPITKSIRPQNVPTMKKIPPVARRDSIARLEKRSNSNPTNPTIHDKIMLKKADHLMALSGINNARVKTPTRVDFSESQMSDYSFVGSLTEDDICDSGSEITFTTDDESDVNFLEDTKIYKFFLYILEVRDLYDAKEKFNFSHKIVATLPNGQEVYYHSKFPGDYSGPYEISFEEKNPKNLVERLNVRMEISQESRVEGTHTFIHKAVISDEYIKISTYYDSRNILSDKNGLVIRKY